MTTVNANYVVTYWRLRKFGRNIYFDIVFISIVDFTPPHVPGTHTYISHHHAIFEIWSFDGTESWFVVVYFYSRYKYIKKQ